MLWPSAQRLICKKKKGLSFKYVYERPWEANTSNWWAIYVLTLSNGLNFLSCSLVQWQIQCTSYPDIYWGPLCEGQQSCTEVHSSNILSENTREDTVEGFHCETFTDDSTWNSLLGKPLPELGRTYCALPCCYFSHNRTIVWSHIMLCLCNVKQLLSTSGIDI